MNPIPPTSWSEDFKRLMLYLEIKHDRWGLFLMLYRHASERAAVVQMLGSAHPGLRSIEASSRHARWMDLENDLATLSAGASAIQIMGLERWLDVDCDETPRKLGHMNMRRDQFAARVPCPVLLWLTPKALRMLVGEAKDLWSWRTGHFRFLDPDAPTPSTTHRSKDLGRHLHRDVDIRSEDLKRLRLGERCMALHELAPCTPTDTLDWGQFVLTDMIRHATSLGDWEDANDLLLLEMIPRARAAGDQVGLADAHGLLADLRSAQEQFEAAVMARDKQVRLLRRIEAENAHERALSALASAHRACGDIRNARRIWERGLLPTYVTRGTRKWQAFTKAEIVRCLLSTEQPNDADLKNAERVLRDEVLPTLPDLAGERATAITFDLLADVLERQGELDDALRIRRREVIPLLAVSKDIRLMAWVACKVADGFAQQGRFEDAIALRADEAIPVFQYLGDKPALAVVEADQAIDRTALADMNAALAAMRGECGESTLNPDRT